jgi:hypothetical protein
VHLTPRPNDQRAVHGERRRRRCDHRARAMVSNVNKSPESFSPARKRQTPAKDAVAGAFAGAIAKTVVAPIERVKLLMQLQFSIDNNTIKGGTTSPANVDTALLSGMRRRCGAWEVANRVYQEQGILAFWRGEGADFSCEVSKWIIRQCFDFSCLRQYTKRCQTGRYLCNEFSPHGLV